MIFSQLVHKDVEKIVNYYGHRNPETILEDCGVTILPVDSEAHTLGFISKILDKDFIFINPKLNDTIKKIVFAHELGHFIYHKNISDKFSPILTIGKQELQANVFAAHLLLSDSNILSSIDEELSIHDIAETYNVTENLVLIKLNEMHKLGFNVKPQICDNNIFKNIDAQNPIYWNSDLID